MRLLRSRTLPAKGIFSPISLSNSKLDRHEKKADAAERFWLVLTRLCVKTQSNPPPSASLGESRWNSGMEKGVNVTLNLGCFRLRLRRAELVEFVLPWGNKVKWVDSLHGWTSCLSLPLYGVHAIKWHLKTWNHIHENTFVNTQLYVYTLECVCVRVVVEHLVIMLLQSVYHSDKCQWVKTSSLGKEKWKHKCWSTRCLMLTCKLWAAVSLIIVYQANLSNLSESPSVHLPVILLLLYYCTPTTLATLHWYFLTWGEIVQSFKV